MSAKALRRHAWLATLLLALASTAAARVTDGPPATRGSQRAELLVRAGDRVKAYARIGGVTAVLTAIAEQSGVANQVIRVINPDSRRGLRARVIGIGEVEVLSE